MAPRSYRTRPARGASDHQGRRSRCQVPRYRRTPPPPGGGPGVLRGRRILKGAFDRVLALAALVILAQLIVAVDMLIKCPRLTFFRQVCDGRNSETFRIRNFRKMSRDTEMAKYEMEYLNEHDGVLFKMCKDSRRAAAGKTLQRLSIDELPQLFNVLGGELSLLTYPERGRAIRARRMAAAPLEAYTNASMAGHRRDGSLAESRAT